MCIRDRENVGDEQFPQELDGAVAQYGVDRDQSVIQLNQLGEMSRSDIFMETIKKLRGFGFHICLSGLELSVLWLPLHIFPCSVQFRYCQIPENSSLFLLPFFVRCV